MIYKNTEFKIFDTDFYQISMVFAFIMDNKANIKTGYEGFVRNIKPYVNKDENYYIFSGKTQIIQYMNTIKEEIKHPLFKEAFISLIKPKIKIKNWENEFSEGIDNLIKDFEFEVIEEGSFVFPYLPVFQYRGPKWIGQLIETSITNIYNGRTGLATVKYLAKKGQYISNNDIDYLESIVEDVNNSYYERYVEDINNRAIEYKEANQDKFLIEAAFRRAPSKGISDIASKKALENGWNGTSNVSIINDKNQKFINGTMAHAFVMSYETELEAFKVWNKYFPKSTILVDTYNTLNAIDILIENNIKPNDVRIDSGDFFDIVPKVRKKLDKVGWQDVGIFISGDITPELLIEFQNKNILFDKSMAGTYYVYCNEIIKKVNAGFVYKIVEYKKNDKYFYPEKKAVGKKNYSGIKYIHKENDNSFIILKNIGVPLNLDYIKEFNEDTIINFNKSFNS